MSRSKNILDKIFESKYEMKLPPNPTPVMKQRFDNMPSESEWLKNLKTISQPKIDKTKPNLLYYRPTFGLYPFTLIGSFDSYDDLMDYMDSAPRSLKGGKVWNPKGEGKPGTWEEKERLVRVKEWESEVAAHQKKRKK
jgi:hypothetical protein